jgi:hypothetical protein
MALASLYNVPTTDEEFHRWSFAHAAHHRDEIDALIAKGATEAEVPSFVLDPVNTDNPTAFLYAHQTMHNNTDALLGIAGYDLTTVDMRDPEQLAAWIYLNAQLHYQEATALGVW